MLKPNNEMTKGSSRNHVGGYAIIMADFASSIIKGQVSSLILALVIVIILSTYFQVSQEA